eukprot:SAG31_NODE_42621_length_270_cov_1.514620_2_plen_66_part_01
MTPLVVRLTDEGECTWVLNLVLLATGLKGTNSQLYVLLEHLLYRNSKFRDQYSQKSLLNLVSHDGS